MIPPELKLAAGCIVVAIVFALALVIPTEPPK